MSTPIRLYEDSCDCSALYTKRNGLLCYIDGSAVTCAKCKAVGHSYMGEMETGTDYDDKRAIDR